MPAFVAFSQEFYENLGDDVTNELVRLLNMMNAERRAHESRMYAATVARIETLTPDQPAPRE